MSATPPPLSLRLGRTGLDELDEIARRRGITRAEAARQAIAETAKRDRRRADDCSARDNLSRDELVNVEEGLRLVLDLA